NGVHGVVDALKLLLYAGQDRSIVRVQGGDAYGGTARGAVDNPGIFDTSDVCGDVLGGFLPTLPQFLSNRLPLLFRLLLNGRRPSRKQFVNFVFLLLRLDLKFVELLLSHPIDGLQGPFTILLRGFVQSRERVVWVWLSRQLFLAERNLHLFLFVLK